MKTAIVTDSNSGITQAEAKDLGVYVLPMPFMIDGETYEEDINLTHEQFYARLDEGADISTSQPSPDSVMKVWESALKEYDEIVHPHVEQLERLLPDSDDAGGGLRREGVRGEQPAHIRDPAPVRSRRGGACCCRSFGSADKGGAGAHKDGLQHLRHRGHAEILKEGRQDHPGGSGARHALKDQAGAADPGGKARLLLQGAHYEAGKEHHALRGGA